MNSICLRRWIQKRGELDRFVRRSGAFPALPATGEKGFGLGEVRTGARIVGPKGDCRTELGGCLLETTELRQQHAEIVVRLERAWIGSEGAPVRGHRVLPASRP